MYFREVLCDHVKCTPADFNHNPGMRSVDPAEKNAQSQVKRHRVKNYR